MYYSVYVTQQLSLFKACKLKLEFDIEGVEELLDIGHSTSVLSENWQSPAANNPVIVIEGLDATGLVALYICC